ncbi:hypothetical protein NDU88_006605 [Pleurodeles waltl]|uniref:Uncharacterized protein n=1 Tax=Pleurodeles waltl TaxID=8319 RepID=A0AAV7RPZ4_PLEWA|nr:hypothetical protein NDU88_006605 [Pleurodeles waltl]
MLASQGSTKTISPPTLFASHLESEALKANTTNFTIPCSNRFSPLARQDLESPRLTPVTLSHMESAPLQDDLLALVSSLKNEVGELKSLLLEITTLLKSKHLPLTCKPKPNPVTTKHPLVKGILSTGPLPSPASAAGPMEMQCLYSRYVPPSESNTSLSSNVLFKWDTTKAFCRNPYLINNNYIYMCNVPSLPPNTREDKASLVNKVLHWLRHIRACGSVIHDDVLSAERVNGLPGSWDFIKLNLKNPHLVTGLLDMEAPNTNRKSSAIFLSDSHPSAGHMQLNPSSRTANLALSRSADYQDSRPLGHQAFKGTPSDSAPTTSAGPVLSGQTACKLDFQGATSDID